METIRKENMKLKSVKPIPKDDNNYLHVNEIMKRKLTKIIYTDLYI